MHNLYAICDDVKRLESFLGEKLMLDIREERSMEGSKVHVQTPNTNNVTLFIPRLDESSFTEWDNIQMFRKCLVCVTVEDAFSKSIWNKVDMINKRSANIEFLIYICNLEEIDPLYHLQVPEKLKELIQSHNITKSMVSTSLQEIEVLRIAFDTFLFEGYELITSEVKTSKVFEDINYTYAESENSPAFEHRIREMVKDAYTNAFSRNFSVILNYNFCKKSLNSQEKVYRWIDSNMRIQSIDESSLRKTVENHLFSERETIIQKLKHRLINSGKINEKTWNQKVGSKESLIIEKFQYGAREISLESQGFKSMLSNELVGISNEFEKIKRKKILFTFLGTIITGALLVMFPSVLFTLLAKTLKIEVQAGDLIEMIKSLGDLNGLTYLILGIIAVFYIIVLYEIIKFVLNSRAKSKLEKRTRKIYEKVEKQVVQSVEEDVKHILSKVVNLKQTFIEDYLNCLRLQERE